MIQSSPENKKSSAIVKFKSYRGRADIEKKQKPFRWDFVSVAVSLPKFYSTFEKSVACYFFSRFMAQQCLLASLMQQYNRY